MLQQDALIINKLGLHARASAKFTQLASQYPCEVWLSRNGRRVKDERRTTLGGYVGRAELAQSHTKSHFTPW